MKKLLILSAFLYGVFYYSQIKTYPTNDFASQKNFLNSVHFYKNVKTKNFVYNIFIYDNESGSANFEGSDEVSSNLLITKSEYGENEKPKIYLIKNLIYPKFIKLNDKGILTIEYVNKKKIKQNYILE